MTMLRAAPRRPTRGSPGDERMNSGFTESVVEQAALAWLESLGWSIRHGLEIAPGEPGAARADYAQVVLEARLNPALPPEALADAFRRLTQPRRRRVGGAQSRAAGRRVVGSLRFG
jgi:hypothetical protein